MNTKFNYTIIRYETMQDGNFLVAFNLTDDFGNSAYIEALPLKSSEISGKSAQEICQMAYESIKDKINKKDTQSPKKVNKNPNKFKIKNPKPKINQKKY